MELPDLALWQFCALAAAVFAADDVARAGSPFRSLALMLAAAGAGVWLFGVFRVLPPVGGVTLIGLLCAWRLLRGAPAWALQAGAGAAAGIAAATHHDAGLPWLAATTVALPVPCASCLLSRRAAFAPMRMSEQALCGLTLAAPAVAAAPLLAAGWQSAVTLNQAVAGSAAVAFPGWVWQLALVAALAGTLHSLWIRR